MKSPEPVVSEMSKSEALMEVFNELLDDEVQNVVSVNVMEAKAAAAVADNFIEEIPESPSIQVSLFSFFLF